MHNPCRGVVTSEHFNDGGYRLHAGRDIGTRELDANGNPAWVYGVGKPVYAAFAGRWKKIVRWSKKGNKKSTWAKNRTGNGGLVANPDGEGQGYNHVLILPKWEEGDWIEKGELIGHLDLSGQMSAPHLHFETWRNWKDPDSHFSPKILFDKYRVNTMDDPEPGLVLHGGVVRASDTTKSTPKPKPATGKDWLAMASEADVRKIIKEENEALYERLLAGIKWARIGHDDETLRTMLHGAMTGAQAAYSNTVQLKSSQPAILEAVAEAAAKGEGLTPEQVAEIAAAAEKGAEQGAQNGLAQGLIVETNVKAKQEEEDK